MTFSYFYSKAWQGYVVTQNGVPIAAYSDGAQAQRAVARLKNDYQNILKTSDS